MKRLVIVGLLSLLFPWSLHPKPHPRPAPKPMLTCGAAGGLYCASSGSCPNGLRCLGPTSDCTVCCGR